MCRWSLNWIAFIAWGIAWVLLGVSQRAATLLKSSAKEAIEAEPVKQKIRVQNRKRPGQLGSEQSP